MTVLITGAAGGFGRALAIECAKRGYSLILTDVNVKGLETIRDGLVRQYNASVLIQGCDLTNDDEVGNFMKTLTDLDITVDMLLNVAGIDFEGGFLDREYGRISAIIRLNIDATLRMTHAVLSIRNPSRKLYIVFISSLASMYPMPLKATYAASKRFLLDFSMALRQELKEKNVRVMSVCPGGLPTTPDTISAIAAQGFWGSVTTNHLEKVANQTVTRALKGKGIYIPGTLNKGLNTVSKLFPNPFIARLLYSRWKKAQNQWLNVNG